MTDKRPRIVVLASGRGSNFCALADAALAGKLGPAEVVALVVDRPDAVACQEAERRSIAVERVSRKNFSDRETFEDALAQAVAKHRPDWVCLAGFLRLLSGRFLGRWPERVVNIHPSLLPSFPGLDAQEQAVAAGVRISGCTVHLVTEALDAGPIVLQATCPVEDDDTGQRLAARLLPIEHATYVAAMSRLVVQPFVVEENRLRWR